MISRDHSFGRANPWAMISRNHCFGRANPWAMISRDHCLDEPGCDVFINHRARWRFLMATKQIWLTLIQNVWPKAKCSLYSRNTANGENVWCQLFYLFGPVQRQLCEQQLRYFFRKSHQTMPLTILRVHFVTPTSRPTTINSACNGNEILQNRIWALPQAGEDYAQLEQLEPSLFRVHHHAL